ncbi:UNVERIFIED_CONTAM: hypothetical protein Sindi_0667700, partial [Sesamum indicum]
MEVGGRTPLSAFDVQTDDEETLQIDSRMMEECNRIHIYTESKVAVHGPVLQENMVGTLNLDRETAEMRTRRSEKEPLNPAILQHQTKSAEIRVSATLLAAPMEKGESALPSSSSLALLLAIVNRESLLKVKEQVEDYMANLIYSPINPSLVASVLPEHAAAALDYGRKEAMEGFLRLLNPRITSPPVKWSESLLKEKEQVEDCMANLIYSPMNPSLATSVLPEHAAGALDYGRKDAMEGSLRLLNPRITSPPVKWLESPLENAAETAAETAATRSVSAVNLIVLSTAAAGNAPAATNFLSLLTGKVPVTASTKSAAHCHIPTTAPTGIFDGADAAADLMHDISNTMEKNSPIPTQVRFFPTGLFVGNIPLTPNSNVDVDDKIADAFNNSSRRTLSYIPPTIQNGEVVVRHTMTAIFNVSTKWKTTAVGYFLGKQSYFYHVKDFAFSVWPGLREVMATTNGFFFFQFKTVAYVEEAIEGGPWLFQGQPIVLQKWESGMVMRKLKHTQVPVWIKLRHLLVELWTEEGLSTVASGIGKSLYPDAITRACMRLDFARVCVMLD